MGLTPADGSLPPPGADPREAKEMARSVDPADRSRVASCRETAPELLYYLAGDPDAMVREAVAGNAGTPAQASRLLAADSDPNVRAVLARRIATMAPGLSEGVQDRLQRMMVDALATLVEDQAVEVRATIAEVVKDLPDAPRDLILRLAQDAALPVAEPVIRFSPLLGEADLLALVTSPPAEVTRRCVAGRQNLSERISDAIAASADEAAIEALLGNASAAIREATLDVLADRAGGHPAWHMPFVQRPRLSARAVRALGAIVADQLLDVLAQRPDLDAATAATLRSRVRARMAEPEPSDVTPVERLTAALERHDRITMLRALAEAACLPEQHVERAVSLRSARALLSLCWKAGLTPALAERLQPGLANIPPPAVLRPKAGDWPLSVGEMEWQLELLASE